MSRDRFLESAKVIFDANGDEVCRIDYEALPTGARGIRNSDENAALIAAAPDLMAALEWYMRVCPADEDTTPAFQAATNAARAALAKARGQ